MSFLYRGGKLPFCLGRFPYFHRQNITTISYGEGTTYPLDLTVEQYAACFWRVKTWKFSGILDGLAEFGDATVSFYTEFERTFTRDVPEEKYLICKENKQDEGIWPALSNEGDYEYSGTVTRPPPDGTEGADLLLECGLGARIQSNQLVDVALRPNGNLQCYFAFTILVTARFSDGGDFIGTPVFLSNLEDYNPPSPPLPYVGPLQIYLPNMDTIEINVYGFCGDGGPSEFKIEPIEFFTWDGLYNSATGVAV